MININNKIDSSTDDSSEEEEEENINLDSLRIKFKNCENCEREVDKNAFKSIKWNKETKKIDQITFCTLKCIEDFDWKKHKYNRRKSKKQPVNQD